MVIAKIGDKEEEQVDVGLDWQKSPTSSRPPLSSFFGGGHSLVELSWLEYVCSNRMIRWGRGSTVDFSRAL